MASVTEQPAGTQAWLPPVPAESPCLPIHGIVWDDAASLPAQWALRSLLQDTPGYGDGGCLGVVSLGRLRQNLDARLVQLGFVTSRILLPPQNLKEGLVRLQLQLGRIGRVVHRRSDSSTPTVPPGWLPIREGDVLNLRAIEQGLENAARLPSLAAQVVIEPGDEPGLSNVVLLHGHAPAWRGAASIDNLALADFGRWQTAVQASWDLGLLGADQISFWHQRSLPTPSHEHRQHRTSLHYSTAWGAQFLSLGLTEGQTRRVVQGTTVRFGEASSDESAHLQWQAVLWRSGGSRLSVGLEVSKRRSRSAIEQTELLLQRRRSLSGGWGLRAQWRGQGWAGSFSAQRMRTLDNDPRIESIPAALPLPRNDSVDGDWQMSLGDWPVLYQASLSLRWVRDPAYGADLMAVGGPGSVRGFDGSRQAVGFRSALLRQDLTVSPQWMKAWGWEHQLLLGLDVGQVGRADAIDSSPGHIRRLVGTQIAIRSLWPARWLSSELGLAKSLQQPQNWPSPTPRWTLQVNAAF